MLSPSNGGHIGPPLQPSIKITLLLAPLLALALVGCDLESNQSNQSLVENTPTTVATALPVAQSASPTTAPVSSPTGISLGGSTVPGAGGAPRTYTVQPGDTLSQIAEQFDMTAAELMEANDISSADFLQIDQVLTIPSAGSTARTTPAPVEPTKAIAVAASSPTSQAIVAEPAATEVVEAAVATPTSTPPAEPNSEPMVVNGRTYDAYNQAAIKKGQWYQYTCEFDAAWIVLKTYGFDVGLQEMVDAVGLDDSIEPYYKETKDGIVVYGGDITSTYSGNYRKNFLARSTGQAMRKAFEAYGLEVTAVQDRTSLEAALLRGELVWIKTTVDFKPWVPVTWVMPDGRTAQGVLGNDHALVVMGFNKDVVVIRDPLGPTSTGRDRPYGYDVPWKKFMAAWGAQEYDGLAVAPPGR
ncbi:MAG: LysM peptidoglycan-binding domain-containing protein [Chloroflexia bacterium]